jgi:hypothetical protein
MDMSLQDKLDAYKALPKPNAPPELGPGVGRTQDPDRGLTRRDTNADRVTHPVGGHRRAAG